jgi:hypothetical protein
MAGKRDEGTDAGFTLLRVRLHSEDEGILCVLRDSDIWPALRESLRIRDRGTLVEMVLGLVTPEEGGHLGQGRREGWSEEDLARAARFRQRHSYPVARVYDPERPVSGEELIEVIEGDGGIVSMGYRFREPLLVTHMYERYFDQDSWPEEE